MVFLSLLWIANLTACGSVSGDKKNTNPPASSAAGKLYVANAGDGSLIAFDQAVSAQGNIAPSRRFPENITGPTGIFLDRTNDTLYVANTDHNSILIYENASTLNLSAGTADATRVISGPKTGLEHPFGVAYDATPNRERLYVANKDNNSISVFQKDCPQANNLNGDIAPCRTLSGAATLLDFPRALAVDADRDILYISNLGTNSILVYENASQSATQGDLAPTRTITAHSDSSQPESMLNLPEGVFIDSANDRLYVINAGGNHPAVFIYENASARSGGTLPDRVLVGQSTQLSSPIGIDLSVSQDRLYVLNNNNTNNGSTAVMVFDRFNTQCAAARCDFAPTRVITGDKTGLANPAGIAFDPTHQIVYIANAQGNSILIFALEGDIPPQKINTGAGTGLYRPNGFFYDQDIDRLYVASFTASAVGDNTPTILVYENVSSKTFSSTLYDWAIKGGDRDSVILGNPLNLRFPRAVYIDKTRGLLLVLNGQDGKLVIYDLNVIATPPSQGGVLTISNPIAVIRGFDNSKLIGFTGGTNMAVDEVRGEVYIAADCTSSSPSACFNAQPNGNSIFVYGLNDLATDDDPVTSGYQKFPIRVIGRGCNDRNNLLINSRGCESSDLTTLNRPFGIFLDTQNDTDASNDILYVTNTGISGTGANTILAFHNPSTLGGTITSCDNHVISSTPGPSPCNVPPTRVISSSATFTTAEKLNGPTAPFVDSATDRLYLINWENNALLTFDDVGTLSGAARPSRIVSGTNSLLVFAGSGNDFTGALFVDTSEGKETIYVGQPKDPACSSCLTGALLVFGLEGNVPPSRTWSGGGAPLIGPSGLAVDTTRDILYIANLGDAAQTTDDSLSILTKASEANGNLPMTGTLSVANGSFTVTGEGTIFTKEFTPGDSIKIGTTTFTVASVASDTSLALTIPYPDATDSGVPASLRPRSLCSPSSGTCGAPDVKLNNPGGLFVDSEKNHLYVSNMGSDPNCSSAAMPCNALLVFHGASNLSNNAVPDLFITSTALNEPRGLAVDLPRSLLYVANSGGHSVLLFKNVRTMTGTVTLTPDAEIGGIASGINTPVGVAIDSERDILYVLNQGTLEVLVFENASSQNGNVAPSRVISGSGFMVKPSALFLDPLNDFLYVADEQVVSASATNTPPGAIYIFTDAHTAEGAAEHRTLTGNNTALNKPVALFVDTTR